MKRRGTCTTPGGGGGEGKRNTHTTRTNKKKQKTAPPLPPVLGTVATRTRRQTREIATKWTEPIAILIHILSYADPETIRQACCVSKQFHDLIYHNPGMVTNRVVPLLEIRPSENTGDEGRVDRLVEQLYHRQNKLQRYVTLRIIDPVKFKREDLRRIIEPHPQLRLNGIVSLVAASECCDNGIMYALSKILPNLQEINLSNTITECGYEALSMFSNRCNRLEKVTWNNIDRSSDVSISGGDIWKATNLREIYMDESIFYTGSGKTLSDLANSSDRFLFHACGSTVLERVSIRNTKWYDFDDTEDPIIIPQNALIKFVRNAPKSLRWFRSNLTTENISMLRSERPEIELVN